MTWNVNIGINPLSWMNDDLPSLGGETPLETALRRILSGRPRLKWYEAGMDLGLHPDVTESYKLFQARIQTAYERIVPEFGLEVMDATRPVEIQQRLLRQMVTPLLEGVSSRTPEART